ncbi:hypothetical protein [Singulisphaera sp. PoT]|uniref:hypothetical protein n=1 Tax=Singulisphaera sp. PoT TaxID=3411797 RepID=UPI003BF4B262
MNDLENVLNQIVQEESRVTFALIKRWCGLYPEFLESLARFFAMAAVNKEMPSTGDFARVEQLTLQIIQFMRDSSPDNLDNRPIPPNPG